MQVDTADYRDENTKRLKGESPEARERRLARMRAAHKKRWDEERDKREAAAAKTPTPIDPVVGSLLYSKW